MKRVLTITGTLNYGGVERLLVDAAKALKEKGHYEPIICNLGQESELEAELAAAKIQCFNLAKEAPGKNIIKTLKTVRKIIKEVRPDIIHTHQFASDFYGSLAAIGLKIPVVSHLHNPQAESRSRQIMRFFLTIGLTDAFIASSEEKEVAMRKWAPWAKTFVLHNAIDEKNLLLPAGFEREKFRQTFGLSAQSLVVGAVGRLSPEKGFDILLESFEKITTKKPETFLMIVGSGPEEKNLKALAVKLEISDKVIFTGYRRDIAAIMSLFDLMAVSSRTESFCLAALEAMFVGTPIIITDRLSTKDIFAPAAAIVPLSPESLSVKILELLDNNQERIAMAGRGKKLVKENFMMETYVLKSERIYEEITKNKK
ncbi:MAG: glycosyltransferase [bacterium]|nr:glycosyltransferase [bacterium]